MRVAAGYLRRWGDGFTLRERDDLVQEVAMAAWRLRDTDLAPRRWRGLVRTISHRTRLRALAVACRAGHIVAEGGTGWDPARDCERRNILVGGAEVPVDWLLDQLDDCLRSLDEINRILLQSYYEGVGCRDLARRHRMTEDAVKVRLHRGRAALRQRLEARIRVAGLLEPGR